MQVKQLGGSTEFKPSKVEITDKDVYIHPKLKEDLDGIIVNMKNPEKFGKEMGYSGILLLGPPGVGKTLYAQWLAYKTDANFIDVGLITSPNQIQELYSQARQLRDKDKKPVELFIDEIDRFSNREDIADPSQASTLNQLLKEMNGTGSNYLIYTVAATNKPDRIDEALRRPKRFGKEVYFLPPDENGRLEILNIHAYNKDHEFKVKKNDLADLAKVAYGYTGSDLVGVLTEAFTKALMEKRTDIKFTDLQYGLKKIKPSAIRDMPFKETDRKLDDLCGYSAHKDILRKIMGKGGGNLLLFYGPEGNGKTTFAEAVAKEYGYHLIFVSASEPEDKYVGETGKKIKTYIERAKQLSPSILLFDKVDALVENKGTSSWKSSWTGLLESKLSQDMDGVTTIATVCNPSLLSDTFIGMFNHKIFFGYPAPDDQLLLWEKYIGNKKIDASELVMANSNLSVRSIVNTCKKVKDFELPETTEVYLDLVKAQPALETDQLDDNAMRKKYGDSVTEYRAIRQIMKKNGTHVDDDKEK